MSSVELETPAPGVRLLRLADPDRRNALSPALQADLGTALDAVADERPRALVVTGAGKAFCAGADLSATFGPPGLPVPAVRDRLRATYDSFLRVRRLPIPTIAAVQGAAVGAGVNLALACDVRIVGPRARFGVTFSRLGLHPGGGCTHFLVRALGPQRALSLLLDGATLDAEEAHRAGLVLAIAEDPVAEAVETATRWAELDPGLVADVKRAVTMATDGAFEDVLEFESWAQASSVTTSAALR
ncbi:enoyl-CoA hydratase [Amycolatopsis sp. NPDC098790]|uniref:enoyl-CoA hydratase n=1 Tax=Amycolatopsis sp. NPDC098790 TaxID=3363939 RepID=UPI0037F92315